LLLPLLLQVLFCIKHLDPLQYESITGLHQAGSLAFAAELKERGIAFWLRYVLIPNLTDRVGDIEMLINFAKAQPTMVVSSRHAY
jgi:pyruvate formate lyase activating enzyme